MMGCCSSFSAVTAVVQQDSSRHVNFTTGMVLGASEYWTQFAYHAERDKRIVRETHGYGTLSGLAVSLETDNSEGPKIRVSAGSAASPSGQLICVGREQCGSINQWLQREDVSEAVTATAAGSVPDTEASFPIYLTLCYRDCAVDPVPVPGEPCRNDEELMTPSRIADDYSLSFELDRPAMTEADALVLLDSFISSLEENAGATATLPEVLDRVNRQLHYLFSLDISDLSDADLSDMTLHPDMAPRVYAEIKKLWITAIRSAVLAVQCSSSGGSGDDCVLLAQIDLGVERTPAGWQVANIDSDGESDIDARLDETERPLLLASSASQSLDRLAGAEEQPPTPIRFIEADDNSVGMSQGVIVITAEDPVSITILRATPSRAGHRLTINLSRATAATVRATASGTFDGNAELDMTGLSSVSLLSGGDGDWQVVERKERGAS